MRRVKGTQTRIRSQTQGIYLASMLRNRIILDYGNYIFARSALPSESYMEALPYRIAIGRERSGMRGRSREWARLVDQAAAV